MQSDLLIKNGQVVDPSQGIDRVMNIATRAGKIAALDAPAATEAKQTYDASGKLVCPGFIDIHAHVSSDIVPLAVTPDEAGVSAGCTAVSDAGSVGYLHLHPFRKFAIAPARTDVFVFLNVSPFGEVVLPEVGFDIVDEAEFLKVIEANRDIVKGIKLRAIGELIYANKVDVVDLAVRIARKAGLPLMIHLGMGFNEPLTSDEIASFITCMLGRCEKGDILTHAFTDKPGGVFRLDGAPIAGLEEALARGVYLDAAPGRGHINFNLVKAALARGFAPQALGTDVVRLPEEQPHFYNVPAVASKFMALGMSLNDVIAAATCNPAKMLGEEEKRGSIKVGMTADLTMLGWHEGEFLLHDGRVGNVVPANIFLSPQMVVKRGEMIQVRESHRGHIPTKSTMEALMKK
jgi:dihydroorotase